MPNPEEVVPERPKTGYMRNEAAMTSNGMSSNSNTSRDNEVASAVVVRPKTTHVRC